MKYKTTIEIITEAGDKNEAVEIAGEYLSGNLMSGVCMKCRTKPAYASKLQTAAALTVVMLIIALSILLTAQTKRPQALDQSVYGIDAIQPPLKTSFADKNDIKFKKEWQAVQTREALNYIKK